MLKKLAVIVLALSMPICGDLAAEPNSGKTGYRFLDQNFDSKAAKTRATFLNTEVVNGTPFLFTNKNATNLVVRLQPEILLGRDNSPRMLLPKLSIVPFPPCQSCRRDGLANMTNPHMQPVAEQYYDTAQLLPGTGYLDTITFSIAHQPLMAGERYHIVFELFELGSRRVTDIPALQSKRLPNGTWATSIFSQIQALYVTP